MNSDQKKVVKYFSSYESRFGYDHFLWGAKHFGFYPTGNEQISEKQAQLIMQDLVAEKLGLTNGQTVLDAGCGQGVVSTYLAKKYSVHIDGITIVPFEAARASTLAKECGVEGRTHYYVMDYSATDFPNDHFDAIYTTETLSHSPDIEKTLTEFHRILKPGGKFAFFEYTLAPDERFSKQEMRMVDVVISGAAMMSLKRFRHDQFAKVLTGAGFQNVHTQDITTNVLPSFHRLYQFAKRPYRFIKFFGLQKLFINTTAGYEYYKMAEKGLFRYSIFTGEKPAAQ